MNRALLTIVAAALLTSTGCKKREDRTGEPVAADNTQKNERDRLETLLPTDQGGSQSDRDITAHVRRDVVADGSLSLLAKNVKIITQHGLVTLRGVVKSATERDVVGNHARLCAGGGDTSTLALNEASFAYLFDSSLTNVFVAATATERVHASRATMKANPERASCRGCGRSGFHRSKRRGSDYLLSWLGLFPFRCRSCGHRTFLRAEGATASGAARATSRS